MKLPLDFTEGMVLVFGSKEFNFTPVAEGIRFTWISLYNKMGDTLLRIRFGKEENKIFVDDRARKPTVIGESSENSKIVDLSPIDVDGWKRSGITISVHHCSGFGRYQILFGRTTICYFNKRFPGGATHLHRTESEGANILEDILRVRVYELSDLQPEERRAILSAT